MREVSHRQAVAVFPKIEMFTKRSILTKLPSGENLAMMVILTMVLGIPAWGALCAGAEFILWVDRVLFGGFGARLGFGGGVG